MMEIVNAIKCFVCKDIIFSRARHDYHYCSCGRVNIDGGFDYLRYGWGLEGEVDVSPPTPFKINVLQTRKELYEDWNRRENKYGIIKE